MSQRAVKVGTSQGFPQLGRVIYPSSSPSSRSSQPANQPQANAPKLRADKRRLSKPKFSTQISQANFPKPNVACEVPSDRSQAKVIKRVFSGESYHIRDPKRKFPSWCGESQIAKLQFSHGSAQAKVRKRAISRTKDPK